MEQGARQPPHVVIFPFPALGHVHPMLNLAELLSLSSNIHVTFINALSIHNRLLRCTDLQSRFGRFPGFRFKTINLGLGDGLPHTSDDIMAVLKSLRTTAKPLLKELFLLDNCELGTTDKIIGQVPPVTCLISDGILIIALEVAEERGIPTFHFRTSSASSFWAYYCIPQLIHAGELPFSGNDLDTPIANVKGMESFLRRRDLPSFCRVDNLGEGTFQCVRSVTLSTLRTKGLIFNTFEGLEGPILDQIRVDIPNIYTIGPLHAHLKNKLASESKGKSISSNGLWEEDRSCLKWLDEQPSRSVLYVSFGSVITLTKHELTEFWHGLVNSGQQFLWVIRHDVIKDKDDVLEVELKEGRKENGYIVSWAPQEEVLAHPSIGGFLTHSGWNSTLESLYEAVPMICWPQLADQQVNSRFVGEVWKLGLDLKDTCDRVIIEKMVSELMEARRNEFLQRANEMTKLARASVSEGGSSTRNLDRLIQDIYSI
ncbi:7-deoxyloganetic acid glucosyl transferase-like [Nicotiana tomentosiformis]|uniref:7-deoxyloganetic acid glucosyl transferase-like n=1 Tax=Nicotiana tomentosiformis TaxID=4098 RepID=UPI00051C80CE|nr:7-deoxyloganetic acid glucosyl transferase-like [Nicotiana tomentosiformis]